MGGVARRRRWWLAGLGALFLGAMAMRGWLARDTPSDTVTIGTPLYSADGKYMAVVFSELSGFGLSTSCVNDVSVVPASMTARQAYARRFRVYEGGCHSLGLVKPAPGLQWTGPRELQISFDPRQAKGDVSEVVVAAQSEDAHVRITRNPFHP